jgi:hypothetical protein
MKWLMLITGLCVFTSEVVAASFQNATRRTADATFTNPIKDENGSDPFMVYIAPYCERLYVLCARAWLIERGDYLTTTTWTNVQITRATVS